MFLKPQFSGRSGEDDVSLIRKRRSISGEHSLHFIANHVILEEFPFGFLNPFLCIPCYCRSLQLIGSVNTVYLVLL